MNQATQPPAANLSGAVRALEEAINGLRHSQNILVAAMGIVAALFLGALVWLASDISGLREQVTSDISSLRQQIAAVETRMETSTAAINARIDTLNTRVDDLLVAVGELRAAIGAISTKLDEISRSRQSRAELDLKRSRSANGGDARVAEPPGTAPGP